MMAACPATPRDCWIPLRLSPLPPLTLSALRLGTGICLVPQRQPVYTAKMVADLDYLSGGRVDFGVGIGWLKEEFANLGMDFSTRGPRTEEYLLAMKALWSDGIAEFSGQSVELKPCHFNPKPVQRPHPPIILAESLKLPCVASRALVMVGMDMTSPQQT